MYNRGSKRSAKRTTTAKGKYRQQVIEALEARQLLTTLYGGGAGRAATYVYTTAGATPPTPADAQITIYGNVTAEFIFVDGAGNVVNRPVTFNGPGGVNNGTGGTIATDAGLDIFAIYVSQSDINSYIAIEKLGTSDPFGSVTPLTITAANPKPTNTASSGSGQLRLGALTGGTTGTPVIKTDINGAAIGVRPAGLDDLPEDPNNDLSAGLRVANGNSLGKFLFDGEVFGKVRVDGSMNLFYAGWLLTGDARGANEPTSPATGGRSGASNLPVSLADNFITPEDLALGANGHIVPRQNFYIGGDLQNLVSDGAIGWDGTFGTAREDLGPFYLSGVDIYVRGRVGQIHGNEGNTATVTVLNLDPSVAGFTRPVVYQEELEGYNRPGSNAVGVVGDISVGFPNQPFSDFSGGVLYGPRPAARGVVPVTNDRFDSFQMLGTFSSPRGNDVIDLLGTLNPAATLDVDPIDFYGVSLMAGQTITIQLVSTIGSSNLHLGVFDPDGRLIASDYTNLTTPDSSVTATGFVPLQITADRPGIYRIAVAEGGDVNFVGTPTQRNFQQYELTVGGVGALGLGGVSVVGQKTNGALAEPDAARMLDLYPGTHQIEVGNADFGGVYTSAQFNTNAGRQYLPTVTPAPGTFNEAQVFGTIYVANGNLRTVDSSQIGVGTLTADTTPTGIDLNVPNGSVGLIQTRDDQAVLSLNQSVRQNFANSLATPTVPSSPTTPTAFTPAELSIGGSYQVINAAGRFYGAVAAKAGMSTLRAGTIDGISNQQTFIYLDTDNQGFDGKSDLIDVAGSIDGPALLHGPGGNFRYMRVGGVISYDSYFGSSAFRVAHDYGQTVNITDDSGSNIILTPVGNPVPNPVFDPTNPLTGPAMLSPQLSTQIYPVRSGGSILMDVQSTGSLSVVSQGGAYGATAEISRIEVHGEGAAPVVTTRGVGTRATTTLTQPFTSPALGNEVSVTIGGTAITDVAYIVGMVPESAGNFYLSTSPSFLRSGETAFGNLTLVTNNTGGEILEIHAANLGNVFSSGTVGVTRATTIAGNSLNFIAPLAIGSAYTSRAADNVDDMPIQPSGDVVGNAFPFNGQTYGVAVPGNIVSIRANLGLGNIISSGIIGSVVANSDKRDNASLHEGVEAPIVASGSTVGGGTIIVGIPNASILFVDMGEGMGSAGSGGFARTGIFAGNNIMTLTADKNADVRGDIFWGNYLGSLSLNNGSLIDANLLQTSIIDPLTDFAAIREAFNVGSSGYVYQGGVQTNTGSINLTGNGGVIGTIIHSLTINRISVGGFGILNSNINTSFSGFINSITAGGYGIRNSIVNVGNEIHSINVTGKGGNLPTYQVSPDVRLSEFAAADPVFGYAFDPYSGRALTAVNDIHASLGTSQANPTINGITDTGVVENSTITGQRGLGSISAYVYRGDPAYNSIAFGNSIGTLQARGLINGLAVTTGRIKKFLPAGNVGNLHMQISGSLGNITIKGNLDKGSEINATGPNGKIGNITIAKNLDGTIHAVQTIGNVKIGGNLNGSLKVDALARNKMALKKLQVGGTIANGALDIGATGNVANVGQIIVGKSLGASAADTLHVSGSIARLQVGGTLNATVNVGKEIKTLQAQRIDGPVNAGDVKNLFIKNGGLHGNLTLRNRLQNAKIAGGVFADISANNGIGNVTVSGNVAPGTTIESGFGGIGKLRVSGDFDGGVSAAGKVDQIVVGRNLGDGVTPLTISAPRLGLLQVARSIKSGVTVDIGGPIDALVVGGDIDEGAVIKASTVNKHQINGEVFGSLLIG